MKKMYELGAKTGLSSGEVNRVARFGALGLLTFALAALSGCFKSQKTLVPAQDDKPQTLQDLAASVNGSTTAAKPGAAGGPYPGYPTGTRYYTVSRADFRA